jgi:hypothetical protein
LKEIKQTAIKVLADTVWNDNSQYTSTLFAFDQNMMDFVESIKDEQGLHGINELIAECFPDPPYDN